MSKKSSTNVPKKVPFTSIIQQELTKTEQEVLYYWTKEFLIIKQIATRRQTSERAVRKVMQNLREKGYLDKNNMGRNKKVCGINFNKKKIRFHGLEFNIKILFKDDRYKQIKEKTNFLDVDGNTIRLFKDAIEVYVNHSFYADSVEESRKIGFDYCNRLFEKLESRLKIIISKPEAQNIKLVKHHFAEVNNEFSKELNDKKEKLQIRGDDGKVWLLVDNSMNLNELETIHPELAEKDMQIIKRFFDDVRKHEAKASDVLLLIREYIIENNSKMTELVDAVHSNALSIKLILNIINPNNPEAQKKKSEEKINLSYVG